jgi:hypothetical protein
MAGLDWVQVDVGFPMSLPVVCAARTSSTAAALEAGSSGGRLIPVSAPSDEDVTVAPVEVTPVQLALPGTHMVPVSSPPRDVWRAPASEDAASEPSPVDEESPARAAAAFFETCQEERCRALPGLPAEEQPKAWASWYRGALRMVGGDERRLLDAWRGYIHSDWGRSREPRCTAQAFCSPRVWSRYLEPLKREDPSEVSGQMVERLAQELGLEGVCWRVAEGLRAPLLG